MELRDLECVVAVVDNGGFTAAAAALGMTQPSLSRRIMALERELDAPLFHRLGRDVALTPAGEALIEPARQALHDAETARVSVASVVGLAAGRLAVCALPTLAVTHVVPLLGTFATRHPDVDVTVTGVEDAVAALALVRSTRCDLALTNIDGSARFRDRALVTEPLFDQELVAIFPPHTKLRSRRRLPVATLADHAIVTTGPGTSIRSLVDEVCATVGVSPRIRVETNQRDALIPLVLAGAGCTLLSAPLAAEARERGAIVAHLDPPPRRRVGLIGRAGPRTPAADALWRVAQQRFGRRGRRTR